MSNDVITALSGLAGVVAGGLLAAFAEWLKKRRTPQEVKDDHAARMTDSAAKQVEAANTVVEMLRGMLAEQEKQTQTKIDEAVQAAKQECQERIAELERRYKRDLKTLRDRLSKYENGHK